MCTSLPGDQRGIFRVAKFTALRKLSLFVWTVLPVVLVGCSDLPSAPQIPPSYAPPVFGAQDSVFTDYELRAAMFSTYSGPAGFYTEDHSTTTPYYVNVWSVHSPYVREFLPRYELSTDDPAQARLWADSTIAYSNGMGPMGSAEPLVTPRYIEFLVPLGSRGWGLRLRAHRASYLDRSRADRLTDPFLGTLRVRPIDPVAARGVAEYLWFLTYLSSGKSKPLTSFSRISSYGVVHLVFSATRLKDVVTPGSQEMIGLMRSEYWIDGLTGDISLRRVFVRNIEAVPKPLLPLPIPRPRVGGLTAPALNRASPALAA